MDVWMKVSKDKYELPLCIADSAKELAKLCGTTENTIKSCVSHAKRKDFKSHYVRVKVTDDGC